MSSKFYPRSIIPIFKPLQLLHFRPLVEWFCFLLLPALGVIGILGPSAGSPPLYAQDCVHLQNTNDPVNTAFYYFISKYEISNFQWKSVMEGGCRGADDPFSADDPRPKIGITWF